MMPPFRCPRAGVLLAVLLAPLAAHASALDATRVTLKNGLRVVLAPDSLATSVDAALWFPSGLRHEKPAQAGVALLAARLGFRNGEDDPLAALEAQGGSGALTATPDFTTYSATVPAEALAGALDFLAARLPGVAVTGAALSAERAAIRADRTRGERTPVARALSQLWAAAWPGHPYAQTGAPPGAGSDALTSGTIEAWRRERFNPASAVLTLTGAFDPEPALAEIRTRFEGKPRGAAAPAAALGAPRPALRTRERIDSPARLCLIGWRAPGAGDPDAPAFELLAAWLGLGEHAQLAQVLSHDDQLAVTAQAGFSPQKEGSLLWTLAVVQPGADSAVVERVLLDTVRNAATNGPETFELERARRQLESTTLFALQTSRQRGQALGEAELQTGDAAAAPRRLAALHSLKSDDVRRAANRLLTDSGRATVWLVPAESGGVR